MRSVFAHIRTSSRCITTFDPREHQPACPISLDENCNCYKHESGRARRSGKPADVISLIAVPN